MIEKLEEIFVALLPGNKRKIDMQNDKYITFAFDNSDSYGVYFPYEGNLIINEKFTAIRLYTGSVNGENVLLLTCNDKTLRHNFVYIAADFISLNNNNRKTLISNPYIWFDKWKDTIGNFKKNLMIYDVVGEMKCLLELYKKGILPKWSSINLGTHDIESFEGAYEVKTTINKTDMLIHISSLIQLCKDNNHDLFLLFCRAEISELGYSIDDLYNELIKIGFDKIKLEDYLDQKGYSIGKNERYVKYIIREILKFNIDDNFPKLIPNSFKENKLPSGIESLTYTVDLYNLDSEKML